MDITQPDTDTALSFSSNINAAHDILISLDDMAQTSLDMTLDMDDIQAVNPSHALQPTQDFQVSQEMSRYTFFYTPCNDYQMYHIICEEVPLSFELVAKLINGTGNNSIHNYTQPNNIYMFYYEQPEIKKIYQVTCEM